MPRPGARTSASMVYRRTAGRRMCATSPAFLGSVSVPVRCGRHGRARGLRAGVTMAVSPLRGRGRALDARVVLRAARARIERARMELGRLDAAAAAADAAAVASQSRAAARAAARDAPTPEALAMLLEDLRGDARRVSKADTAALGSEQDLAVEELRTVEVDVAHALEKRIKMQEEIDAADGDEGSPGEAQKSGSKASKPVDGTAKHSPGSDPASVNSKSATVSSSRSTTRLGEYDGLFGADSSAFDGDGDDPSVDRVASGATADGSKGGKGSGFSVPNPSSVVDVSKVREKLLDGRDILIRRASSVGAGLEGRVSEYMKDDGTVDLAKVRLNVRGGLEKFGETWERLNGRDPKLSNATVADTNASDAHSSVVVQHRDEAKISSLRTAIGELEKSLADASKAREQLLRKEDQLGKLIRAREIRAMDDNVSSVRRTLAVKVLQLETEYIFGSLSEEIERSGFEVLEQRVMVAEFGDIDERLQSLAVFVDQNEPVLIDDDDVGTLAVEIQDLKVRLGLDAPLYSSRIDGVMLRQTLSSSFAKAKTGVEFYWRGIRLFGGDCIYAFKLFRRVLVGYTLSPREVRTLRRTGRDLLTLVPFTIILILPLTPVGHVLIFSFLQRYWPDFFPSTFSERRQGLMRRHEQYAKSIQQGEEDIENSRNGATRDGTNRPGEKGLGSTILGGLRRFSGLGKAGSDAASEGSESRRQRESRGELDPIAATSSDVLSSLANDQSQSGLGGLGGVSSEKGRLARAKSGTSIVLDDLHLAD